MDMHFGPGPGERGIDWPRAEAALDAEGFALLPALLEPCECAALVSLYDQDRFRSRVIMSRHGFGSGEYKYFRHPLPEPVGELRARLYAKLAPIANRWTASMGIEADFPPAHEAYLARCHEAGQVRPTPLLLRYGPGDHNCLHQDLYGDHVFPLQVAILLAEPGEDFLGGEFVLTEQRPRRQSRVAVAPLRKGDGIVFAVNRRPVRGARGVYRATMRHGVSALRSGERHTLGILFHDAA